MLIRNRNYRFVIPLIACLLATSRDASADDSSETWKMLRPILNEKCQTEMGQDALGAPTVGVTTAPIRTGEPLRVIEVVSGGPASLAGIQKDDLLWGNDSEDAPTIIDSCELLRRELSGSKDLILYRRSSDLQAPMKVIVHPKPRRDVYPGEAKMSWKLVSAYVDGGHFRVVGGLARGSLGDFELRLAIYNSQTESLLQLDESKIFLLDSQGAEFSHQPFAEWKQSLETLILQFKALAQGMESIPYTPPPLPPPTHYRVSSSVDGSYVLTPMGADTDQVNGRAQVESTVSPEYTPNEQIGQAARSIASIFEAVRIARTNKEIGKLRQRAAAEGAAAEELLAKGTASHLETTTPIAPGAKRTGAIAFVEPKNFSGDRVKALCVVRDTSTNKDYFVAFQFRL